MTSLKLVSANEFSIGIIDLKECLTIADSHTGDCDAFTEALRTKYFLSKAKKQKDRDRKRTQQHKLAMNLRNGLKNYGLYDNNLGALTPLGCELLGLNDKNLYRRFAVHILNNLFGIEILQVIREMRSRNEDVTKMSLARELQAAGFTAQKGGDISLSTTDHTKLLGWLRKADVLPSRGYEINEEVFASLMGYSNQQLDEIQSLTVEQRAFLETFWNVAVAEPTNIFFTKDIVSICRNQYGSLFDSIADQLAAKVFIPLAGLDYFKIIDPGRGRGGKSGQIVATEKLLALQQNIFQVQDTVELPPDLRAKLHVSMAELWKDLNSQDTYVKGLALELLAYRISKMLGLSLAKFRLRGPHSTNGAEVDLVCDGISLQYSRWLVQCKNTPATIIPLDVLAKEIGMAYLLKAHVVLLVTTGEFSSTLKCHAAGLAESSHLQVVLVDKHVLAEYKKKGISFLLSYLKEKARNTMKLKKSQLTED